MSDCGVCLYSEDFGDVSFGTTEVRKARKEHRCCECGVTIARSQRYEHSSGKCEGELWAYKTCLICAEIAQAFFCNGRTFGGILWEFMDEVMAELTTSCLDRLKTPEAKAALRAQWMEWKGLTP